MTFEFGQKRGQASPRSGDVGENSKLGSFSVDLINLLLIILVAVLSHCICTLDGTLVGFTQPQGHKQGGHPGNSVRVMISHVSRSPLLRWLRSLDVEEGATEDATLLSVDPITLILHLLGQLLQVLEVLSLTSVRHLAISCGVLRLPSVILNL